MSFNKHLVDEINAVSFVDLLLNNGTVGETLTNPEERATTSKNIYKIFSWYKSNTYENFLVQNN